MTARCDRVPPDGWVERLRAVLGCSDSATWEDVLLAAERAQRLATRYAEEYVSRQVGPGQFTAPGRRGRMRYYFTFGCGSPLARYYVEVEAADEPAARARMFCWFSQHWSHCYESAESAGVERWGLRRLDVNEQAGLRLGTMHEEVPHDLYVLAYGGPR